MTDWYKINGRNFAWRKRSASKYHKIIVEVLLQRTKAENVSNLYPSFIHAYPNWKALSRATERELQQFLMPLGLWKRRAISLLALSKEMAKRGGRFPRFREEIEKIPSVGQYIANAILLFCHGEPQPLLDAGMARVLERVFGPRKLADIRSDPYLQRLARLIVSAPNPQEMNWAILDLASLICRPHNPKCIMCPINKICLYTTGFSSSVSGGIR